MIKKQQSAKWLRTQQHSDTFKLFEMTKSFFGPLEALLGDKKYLLTDDGPTSIDCIAVGYLSLMQYASVPQPWLADAFRARFPKLYAYTSRVYKETFENPQHPWRSHLVKADPPTPSHAISAMAKAALSWSLPSLKQTVTPDPSSHRASNHDPDPSSASTISALLSPSLLLPIGLIGGIAFGVLKYLSISNSQNSEKHTFYASEHDFLEPARLTDLGESGAILSALGQQFDLEDQFDREKQRTGGATLVEIDVENEKGEVGRDVIIKR